LTFLSRIKIYGDNLRNFEKNFHNLKLSVHIEEKNNNIVQVMHSFAAFSLKVLIFIIFQCFFVIKNSYSSHLEVKVTGFNNATSPVYVWGYDRKFYFDEKSAPLFMVQERDVNRFLNISLKAFPHIVIGLFAFQDIDGNGEFTVNFKGEPQEPYGFSLNPEKNYQDTIFEEIAFDMEKFELVEIKLKQ
jgi:uncharacterized protein (DUF2141 family)